MVDFEPTNPSPSFVVLIQLYLHKKKNNPSPPNKKTNNNNNNNEAKQIDEKYINK